MQCLFEALQPVHIDGRIKTGVFVAEVTEAVEALVDNGLVAPVLVEVEAVTVPVWDE